MAMRYQDYCHVMLQRAYAVNPSFLMPMKCRSLSDLYQNLDQAGDYSHGLLVVLLAHIVPRCVGVITVSSPIVKELRNRYGLSEVTLIRNVPEYRTVSKSDHLREYLGLTPETRIVLYQGYLQPNRGLDRLIRAAAFLEQDIVIVMMGKNRGTTQAQLEALIASEGVADRVKIIPPVPYAELLDWTSSADIGVNVASPDYSLNVRCFLPNKLFEYLMSGVPVLTSSLEAMVEVINTYDVGQVLPSLEPADIGEAINSMLADPAALARMRSNAFEATKEEFNWEKEKLKLIPSLRRYLSEYCREDKPL